MNNPTMFKKKKALFMSICVGLLAMLVILLLTSNMINQSEQKEQQSITEEYIGLQDQINNLINSNILLLYGYSAYVKSFDDITEEKTLVYLEALSQPYEQFIRNIGIIKDTTIIYNYPKEGNEASIGIDLATVEGQKEVVLRTKNLMTPVFQGPLELVQGGQAFIIRLPISDKEEVYWGQVSIVLKAEAILEEIGRFAADRNLKIAIRSNEEGVPWIYGDELIYEKEPLEFKIHTNLLNWRVFVVPESGWEDLGPLKAMSILASMIMFALFASMTYFGLKANYQVKHNSLHDHLTGLYNRHFYDEYQNVVVSAAERNNHSYGLVLVDLNEFKAINDTFGHKVGDIVLKETARVMMHVSRANESVFRLGGDEFLIVIPKLVHAGELLVIRNRIENAFRDEFRVDGYDIIMIPSVGMASYPDNGADFDEVMHYADKNMYEEKYLSKLGSTD